LMIALMPSIVGLQLFWSESKSRRCRSRSRIDDWWESKYMRDLSTYPGERRANNIWVTQN